MRIYILLTFFLPMFLFGNTVFAHGGAADMDAETRHPETQIGLPGSRMGHDEMSATTSGLTRSEVAELIEDTQAIEEKRSAVKIVLLFLAIVGLVYLYFPRKTVIASPSSADTVAPAAPLSQAGGGSETRPTSSTGPSH